MMNELLPFVWLGCAAYAVALFVSLNSRVFPAWSRYLTGTSQLIGILAFLVVIVVRWQRVGHGPFITMYEILLSSAFSLGLVFFIAWLASSRVRSSSSAAFFVVLMLGTWLTKTPDSFVLLPPTYENNWLWVHVAVGKVFLGLNLVAMSLSVAGLVQLYGPRLWGRAAQVKRSQQRFTWLYFQAAFVFHSLMLIAGATWAQDAWGRYWAWDPLETWAFITWLVMVILIHFRARYRLPAWIVYLAILAVFGLAFFTFFGIPFYSTAPHKGAI